METLSLSYSVRPAVYSVASKTSGATTLMATPRYESLGPLSVKQRACLTVLAKGKARLDELSGEEGREEITQFVERLKRGGWLSITVSLGEDSVYTMEPFGAPPPRHDVAEEAQVMSKFTVIRRHHGQLVLENPRSWCDVHVHDPRLLSVICDRKPDSSVRENYPPEFMKQLRADMSWSRCFVEDTVEDADFSVRQWSAHELWFHHRSTFGDRGWEWDGFSATNWARGKFDPLPARRTPYPSTSIPLYTPDIAQLRQNDPGMTAVIEDRFSCRSFDDAKPLSKDELGEILYRSARSRGVNQFDGKEVMSRPYPSGGGAYELEIYPVVRHVDGLAPGIYHYDSIQHELRKVVGPEHPSFDRLLHAGSLTMIERQRPQVLLTIAARPGRLMWTYEQMAYSLMLKHVGTLTQTIYLVTTAMQLGAVGLGVGDAAAFNAATATDQTVECAVGDIGIGTRSTSVPRWYTEGLKR